MARDRAVSAGISRSLRREFRMGRPPTNRQMYRVETSELLPHGDERLRVLDRGGDFLAVSHDARVGEEPFHVAGPVAGDLRRVEAVERRPVSLPLPEDRDPGQPGLRAVEDQELEELRFPCARFSSGTFVGLFARLGARRRVSGGETPG